MSNIRARHEEYDESESLRTIPHLDQLLEDVEAQTDKLTNLVGSLQSKLVPLMSPPQPQLAEKTPADQAGYPVGDLLVNHLGKLRSLQLEIQSTLDRLRV